jgi:hypothetical protein
MPMIYVHGVRHREPDKLAGMKRKLDEVLNSLRRELPALPDAALVPYWGEFGVQPRFQGLLPFDAPLNEDMGDLDSVQAAGMESEPASSEASLEVLRHVSDDDAAAMQALLLHELDQLPVTLEEAADLKALLASDWQSIYLQQQSQSARQLADADPGLDYLDAVAFEVERDLVWERTRAQRLVDLVDRTASKLLMDQGWTQRLVRVIQDNVALFMGDAMTYVIQRESQGAESPILKAVLQAFPTEDVPNEPLIVITHSMGAAIVHDILSTFRPQLTVHCWISVGSQVGQFANLGLLAEQRRVAQGGRLSALGGRVHYWKNIFDRCDFLNYRTEPAFTYVRDREYANTRGPLVSHSWYFKEQRFWELVTSMIKEALEAQRQS